MSGLATLFRRDGQQVNASAVWAMLDAVPYLGPDGMQVQAFGSLGFGHARLVLTPEDQHEPQPLFSQRTGCVLIADVRLDNRDELLATLPERTPGPVGDAELILRAYEAWGEGALPRLLGDFAFVLWDPRRKRLLCARDPGGQRSLFYRFDNHVFAAASEIHQLLQDPAVPLLPDDEQIRDYLVPNNVFRNLKDTPRTFYQGIHSVQAGHVLAVDCEALSVRRFWSLTVPVELRYRSDEEYAEHYLQLFSEVVQARLRSVHPVGVMLSGGLDSASVACVAQELYRAGRAVDLGFTSISFVFDDLDCDEQPFIRDIESKYGFRALYVPCPPVAGWLHAPSGFQQLPNMSMPGLREAVYGAASQAGVRVLLNGDVGDSIIAGGPLVFDRLLCRGQLGALGRGIRAYRGWTGDSLRKIVALYCLAPMLPLPLQRRLLAHQITRTFEWQQLDLLPNWMPAELRADLAQRHLSAQLCLEGQRRFSNPVREDEYRMLEPPELHQQPMPWSMQFWRPFVDRRLHEFMLAIPPEQKFEPAPDSDEFYAASKRLVRRAMRGIVPESIRTRTSKTHFGSVFGSAVERQWPLYESTFGPGSRPEIATRGYVDADRFWARLTWLRAGYESGDFMYVLRLVGLEMWLRGLQLPRAQGVQVLPAATAGAWIESGRTTVSVPVAAIGGA